MTRRFSLPIVFVCAMIALACASCAPGVDSRAHEKVASAPAPKLQAVNLDDPIHPEPHDQPIVLDAAKNEWVTFAIQLSDIRAGTTGRIKINSADLPASSFQLSQILSMPVDVNRAGYVRHTGLTVSEQPLPRALLPITMKSGAVDFSGLRDPRQPTSATNRFQGGFDPVLLWIDVRIPTDAKPGEHACSVDFIGAGTGAGAGSDRTLASVPVKITVHDFALPDERHMLMVSRLQWEDLKRLYPAEFETVAPRLLNRSDERCAAGIRVLDSIQRLAQAHRTQIVIPRLQPTVKWQMGKPHIDWEDLDSLLAPWLSGETFADRVALGYWPLPSVDFLDRFDRQSQLDYWSQAAAHFERNNWIGKSAVWMDTLSSNRPSSFEAIELSAKAAEVLAVHPKIRVTLPLEDDQIQLRRQGAESFVQQKSTDRLIAASPGIVFSAPMRAWPADVAPPQHWLRTDLPGLVPYAGGGGSGGGDERDVRVWSCLAFLRSAGMVLWSSPAPRTDSPRQPADPSDMVWFYPGQWFGVSEPVPTIHLKWLRQAQQDFELLRLARQRGEAVNATLIARLLAKPVEIQPGQNPDPTYGLMCGTADQSAWNAARGLISSLIELRREGKPLNNAQRDALSLAILRWCRPQEQPVLLARQAQWQIDRPLSGGGGGGSGGGIPGQWLSLRLGIDLYNASDAQPDQNLLQWTAMPRGWEVKPQPTPIPALATYRVQRYAMDARYNLTAVDSSDSRGAGAGAGGAGGMRPAEITFTNGFNRQQTRMKVALPVAASDRHAPGLMIDGKLDDWSEADAIQAGPMVRMLNRPALQKQELQYSANPAAVFTGWHDDNFYVSFKLDGISTRDVNQSRNFVDYEFRRAWGEDLCEILIQPLMADNTVGPVLHVVCKPTGFWVERKLDPRTHADPWQPLEGAAIRYFAKMDPAGSWRGEVAIPWKAIMDPPRGASPGIPPFLRFNFVQHNHSTGESASWAGPIDYGRDESLMGLLYLREPNDPGMAGPP